MKLTKAIKEYIDKSILCWLATASTDGMPNVSPKEIFTYYGESEIIIANIASPQTVKNILANNKVCLSFVDVLVQKGFQLKGEARIVDRSISDFSKMESVLLKMTGGNFPFESITVIAIHKAKKILAPSYLLYPNKTSESQQIEIAKQAYGL